MSGHLDRCPQLKDIVYLHYRPQKPGRIVGIKTNEDLEKGIAESDGAYGPNGWFTHHIRRFYCIRFLDGTEKWEIGSGISSHLDTLVEETERKARNHRARLEKCYREIPDDPPADGGA